MGEVYRAHDSRLRRDVALKILPQNFSNDPHLTGRLEREAQLLASLNHPNIASIYGFEESGASRALVMELVQGATLAERVMQGPLPFAEVLPIAQQIAEALEYAHERGIIHRDLKPANIKLTSDDCVKVLDFGLAKALSDDSSPADASASPTLSATRAGIILGTPAYMSPEQARGRTVDRRTDIWSFGCVLFEMLTGKPAFTGETVTDTLAAVLTKEAPSAQLPETTAPRIRLLVQRCLEKDAKKRLQAIGDARIEIEDALSFKEVMELPQLLRNAPLEGTAARTASRWSIGVPILAALFLAMTAALIFSWMHKRNAITPTWTGDMLPGPNVAMGGRISPDGHTIAFQAMIENLTQVAVGSPDTGNWTLLTHDREHGFINEISWTPDGSKLYYDRIIATPIGIYSVPALGGGERLVLENAGCPEVLPDGSLLVIRGDRKGRWRIHHYWPDSQRLEPLSGWVSLGTTIPLRVFPDGTEAVFYGFATEKETAERPYLVDLATGKSRLLTSDFPSYRNSEGFPIATTADGRGVLLEVPAGDLHRIVVVPRDGKGGIQTLLTLTKAPWYMDMAKDSTLYVDQIDRPRQILRFPVTGGQPEVLASSDTFASSGNYTDPVQTADGRLLLDTQFSGRGRLMIGKPGEDFLPLLDTNEKTSTPAVTLGSNQVALLAGEDNEAVVVIASTVEGRLVRRLQGTKGMHITALAASPDSKTLYFGADGSIYAIPVTDGTPQKVGVGEQVGVVPDGRDLVVARTQASSPVLVKVPATGGQEIKIPLENGQSIAPVPIGARSINDKGKMVIAVSPSNSWFYRVVVLDLATGRVTLVKVAYVGDTLCANWAPDGRVLSIGLPLKSHVWRFRMAAK
jgi:Tol biopolymer transport system component